MKDGDEITKVLQDLERTTSTLSSLVNLACLLITIATNMSPDSPNEIMLKAILTSYIACDIDEVKFAGVKCKCKTTSRELFKTLKTLGKRC